MGKFVKGDIVVVPFPFSDLTANKKRPALVVSSLVGDDVILCQITSKKVSDMYAIPLGSVDFQNGTLPRESNIRPNRLFTADSHIILRKTGTLYPEKIQDVVTTIIKMIS